MLPLSVLIPTRNSMGFLPRHVEMMRSWIDLAEEVIVVDSDSTDGTAAFLREKLPGANLRVLQHPPGLYASWNHGIRNATKPYLYISTVGDGITREGLLHLMEVAECCSPDVVVSPPNFVDQAGNPMRHKSWPVHQIVSFLELGRPVCFEGLGLFVLALSFSPFAILGSSASNLYRTAVLQRNPFPTDFGSNGDGAWGALNALSVRFAVTPTRMSFFRNHRRPHPIEYPRDGDERMLAICLRNLEQYLAQKPELKTEVARLGLDQLIAAKCRVQGWRTKLVRQRRWLWPWVLNPFAWLARSRRNQEQQKFELVLREVLTRVRPLEAPAWQTLPNAQANELG